jgi:hypothetical protein
MVVDSRRYNVPFRAPAIPYAPKEYNPQDFDEIHKVLRIYFNQLDSALRDNTDANKAEAMGWYTS